MFLLTGHLRFRDGMRVDAVGNGREAKSLYVGAGMHAWNAAREGAHAACFGSCESLGQLCEAPVRPVRTTTFVWRGTSGGDEEMFLLRKCRLYTVVQASVLALWESCVLRTSHSHFVLCNNEGYLRHVNVMTRLQVIEHVHENFAPVKFARDKDRWTSFQPVPRPYCSLSRAGQSQLHLALSSSSKRIFACMGALARGPLCAARTGGSDLK